MADEDDGGDGVIGWLLNRVKWWLIGDVPEWIEVERYAAQAGALGAEDSAATLWYLWQLRRRADTRREADAACRRWLYEVACGLRAYDAYLRASKEEEA